MKNRMWIFLVFGLLAHGLIAQNEGLKKQYEAGKEKCLSQNWDEAISIFRQMIEECPGDAYCDDALFWLGYSLEKKGENPEQAFQSFEEIVSNYSASPWADDARMHQIGIAEKLISQGQQNYLEFLAENLNANLVEIRRQAAISLGKFGDKRALPELNQVPETDEQYAFVRAIIDWIGTKSQREKSFPAAEFTTDFHAETSDVAENEYGSLIKTERERQYIEMLRDDDNWSQRELIRFALWHLLPPAKFKEFYALTGYDQDEWLRKYWHSKDPTPTTGVNEYQNEILRRIAYARKHYATLVQFHNAAFLGIQYLSEGRKHAPWDARGELYIKYGEADVDKFYAFQTEEWTYWKMDMDFIVRQYTTNIYGNAISAGLLTQKKHPGLSNAFYSVEEPVYQHDYQAKMIKDIDLKVIQQNDGVFLRYRIASDTFKAIKNENQYIIRFRQRIVIFDADQRQIYQKDQEVIRFYNSKKEIKQHDQIEEMVNLDLAPGKYEAALRLTDQNSDKLGIWRVEFVVK